ncbi:hypothetical protein [Maribellus sp. YY47]|uniref:hypothetical protein n=1 Tax=Maribellus sp. YY47 TaxID=2929486 RepID=UPI002001B93C|nr:hypothetical protein [Maribellus sp. YY47]MCK3683433.1 hypothetical protein [Maribellus sp. YY47]
MKKCPHCSADVEEVFELCWNCNYSFSEQKVIEIKDYTLQEGNREVNCLRCDIPLIFSGRYDFHEGARLGAWGNLFELFVNAERFDLYACPKCGKVEFFIPLNDSQYRKS